MDLNEITKGNPKKKSEDQIKTIKNIKHFYESRKKVIKLYNDYSKIRSKLSTNQNMVHDVKY